MERFSVTLPEAPPAHYLAWMAFWREVEQKVGTAPSLQDAAAEESAPFVRDDLADLISQRIVGAITAQATEALKAGEASIAPTIEAVPEVLAKALTYVTARVRWMTPERLEAMGIEPLDPKLVELRARVVKHVLEQLTDAGYPHRLPGSESGDIP